MEEIETSTFFNGVCIFSWQTILRGANTKQVFRDDERLKRPFQNTVFFSYRKPYKEIAIRTVSGWIKKVLQLANVDTNVFKGHYTRSSSTSKVNLKWLALSDILHKGTWSRASTWQKFYNNVIVSLKRNSSLLFSKTIDIRFKRRGLRMFG